MSKAAKQTTTIQFSLVPEFSWWKSSDGQRLFCVIEVHGKGVGNDYQNTHVCLVEVGIMTKKTIPYEKFTAQIYEKKLVQVHYSDGYIWARYFNRFRAFPF